MLGTLGWIAFLVPGYLAIKHGKTSPFLRHQARSSLNALFTLVLCDIGCLVALGIGMGLMANTDTGAVSVAAEVFYVGAWLAFAAVNLSYLVMAILGYRRSRRGVPWVYPGAIRFLSLAPAE